MSVEVRPAAALSLRLAAVSAARRSELVARRWDDLDGVRLRIESSVGVIRYGTRGAPLEPELGLGQSWSTSSSASYGGLERCASAAARRG